MAPAYCIPIILTHYLGEPASARRSRCIGHIINLVAQSFLHGKDCEAFLNEEAVDEAVSARNHEVLRRQQARWRKKGPVGKFHNIMVYIRRSPQRRQQFSQFVKNAVVAARDRGKLNLALLALF
jgi:hypothetical protein